MTARVLVVGLDAGDPATALALAAAGRMPALARLLERGAAIPVTEERGGSYVAERWTSMVTGVGPEVHRYVAWAEFDPRLGAERSAPLDRAGVSRVWDVLSAASLRVAVLDVPRQPLAHVNGIQLCEWGAHDRDDGTSSWPPELGGEIEARFGAHPVGAAVRGRTGQYSPFDVLLRSEVGPRTLDQLRELATLLSASAEIKAQVSEHFVADDEWDLFFTVFAETHWATHHFWHLHRPADDDDRRLAAALGDVVADTFARIDVSLARHVELAGRGATLIVVLHTGMARPRGGNRVLREVLAALTGSSGAFSTCSFANQIGTIRLHVDGRDDGGTVPPQSIPEVVERLTGELGALVDDDTGAPAVHSVRTRAEVFPGHDNDLLPDLFVEWNGDHVIRGVSSPTLGTLTADTRAVRTADHTPDGLVVVSGPGIEPGPRSKMDPVEVAPMIAGMLGVDYPEPRHEATASASSA